MKSRVHFFTYAAMSMLLIIDVVHFTVLMKFLTCLTFAVVVLIENVGRAQTNETLSRVGLEIRGGKLYFEHTARQISLYDVIALKKEK